MACAGDHYATVSPLAQSHGKRHRVFFKNPFWTVFVADSQPREDSVEES